MTMAPPTKAESGLFSSAGTTQLNPPSRSTKLRAGGQTGSKTGTATPQHVQIELKQRILFALGRLADRDTQQIAIEDLDKIVDTISPDCIPLFLSCLYDSEIQQKSVVKKECVRLFSSLASLHADLLVPHLTKIIASIMRRLRDPDSSVRDACVDAIGSLSSLMLCPPSSTSSGLEKENGTQNASALTLATFTKPLFDALGEQNKSVQMGAALCLARVIESAKSPPLSALARLCPRICKYMSNPNFLARPALLGVVGSLSQVGALNQQQLALVVPCIHEALESNDWATRKAAAETLSRMGTNLGEALSSFKLTTLQVLEASRFDKVKPVRDSISDATQVWKELAGVEFDSFVGTSAKTDGADLSVSMPSGEAHGRKEISSLAGQSPVKEKKLENSAGQASKSSEKPLEAVKKRVHLLNDKKLNPEFFQKLNIKDPEDWQIEVALPQSLPPPKPHYTALSNAEGNLVSDSTILNLSSEARQVVGRKEILKKDLCLNSKGIELHNEESRSLVTNGDFSSGHLSRDLSRYGIDFDRNISKVASLSTQDAELNSYSLDSASTGTCLGTEESKWQVMQEKLDQIEQQQSHLLQMVQEIRVSYQENIMSLKGRLWNLENVVESLLDDLVSSGSKNHKVTTLGVENNELRVSGRYMAGSEYATSRLNMNENSRFLMDKVKFPDTVGNHTMGHNSQEYSEVPVDDWEDDSYRGSLVGPHMFEGQILGRRTNVFTKFEREDSADNHGAVRRLWDRVPGASRLGEGPSARSVWQASKDEATLAAIRVAGEDSELPEIDAHVNTSSQLPRPDLEADKSNCKSGNGHVQRTGRHWNLWSHVLRFVQQGDMESAYTETLFSEDEHMLIKLMNRTGPVLDQLSSTTASEMLHAVGVLLQHQNYFDACLCWIQQVADMVVAGNEPDLDITLDVRKELLMSLQETSNMDLPDGWRGSGIDELLQQLAIAWSLDIEAVE